MRTTLRNVDPFKIEVAVEEFEERELPLHRFSCPMLVYLVRWSRDQSDSFYRRVRMLGENTRVGAVWVHSSGRLYYPLELVSWVLSELTWEPRTYYRNGAAFAWDHGVRPGAMIPERSYCWRVSPVLAR